MSSFALTESTCLQESWKGIFATFPALSTCMCVVMTLISWGVIQNRLVNILHARKVPFPLIFANNLKWSHDHSWSLHVMNTNCLVWRQYPLVTEIHSLKSSRSFAYLNINELLAFFGWCYDQIFSSSFGKGHVLVQLAFRVSKFKITSVVRYNGYPSQQSYSWRGACWVW